MFNLAHERAHISSIVKNQCGPLNLAITFDHWFKSLQKSYTWFGNEFSEIDQHHDIPRIFMYFYFIELEINKPDRGHVHSQREIKVRWFNWWNLLLH